jgi:hypothetical protein
MECRRGSRTAPFATQTPWRRSTSPPSRPARRLGLFGNWQRCQSTPAPAPPAAIWVDGCAGADGGRRGGAVLNWPCFEDWAPRRGGCGCSLAMPRAVGSLTTARVSVARTATSEKPCSSSRRKFARTGPQGPIRCLRRRRLGHCPDARRRWLHDSAGTGGFLLHEHVLSNVSPSFRAG